MKFRITVLCENSVGPISGTLGEHGFAALIESAGAEPILFDTGQGATLLHNARRMNKDLSKVDCVAISHGHYDHAVGECVRHSHDTYGGWSTGRCAVDRGRQRLHPLGFQSISERGGFAAIDPAGGLLYG